MPQLIAQAVVMAVVSYVVGKASAALTKSRASDEANPIQPSPPRTSTENLTATAEVGAAQIGIFGHRRVAGKLAVSAKAGTKTYLAFVIAGAAVTSVNGVYFNNRLVSIDGAGNVTSAPWASGATYSARVKVYTGAQTVADPWLVAAFPGWTADHVGKGLTYAVVELNPAISPTIFDDVYAAGIPDVTFDVSGFKCYDPRAGGHVLGNPATWAYSANTALIRANYLIHPLGAALPTSEVDWASVAVAAAIDDQAVTLKGGGTESRYTCAALWNTDERHEEVLARMNAACAGGVHLVGQKWRVYSGAYTAPTAAISPADYVGAGLSWSDTPPLSELVNGVRGKFCSPLHGFEDRDFPAYQDAAAAAADGREAWRDLDLSFVTSHTQAQRLAKIALQKGRHGFIASAEVKFDFFDVVADDVITLTDDLAGFAATTFRVRGEEVGDAWAIRLTLEWEADSFWDWTPATDERDFVYSEPLQGEAGNAQPPGGWLFLSGSPNINLNVAFWPSSSPTTAVDQHRATHNTGTPAVATVAATAMSVNLANLGTGGAAFASVDVAGVVQASGEVSALSRVSAGGAQTSLAGASVTTPVAPHYGLPPPRAPRTLAVYSGAVRLGVPHVPGSKSAQLEIWENTTNNSGSATLVSTQNNVGGGISLDVSGAPGAAKFYWARTKNAADSKFSPFSNPALVVF